MFAVYAADRGWRTHVERALREQGALVRVASRPAELAKCLADGAVQVVIAGASPNDQRDVQRAAGSQPYLCTSPGDTMASIVHRAMMLLANNEGESP